MKFKTAGPAKTKVHRDDDDEDEEEETPRRSRRDEVKPAKIKRRAKDRYDDDDDDEDDGEDDIPTAPMRSGWKSVDKLKEESSSYAADLKLTDENCNPKEPQLIRFLSDEPHEVYRQHWVEKKGKKSYVCLESSDVNGTDKDCPLCALNNPARRMAAFHVVLLDEDIEPVIKTLTAGPKLTDQIKSFHLNKKSGPIDKMYYTLAIAGKKQSVSYPMIPIKTRDLEEDYDVTPLTPEELRELRKKADAMQGVFRNGYKELLKVARGSVGEDDDDDD